MSASPKKVPTNGAGSDKGIPPRRNRRDEITAAAIELFHQKGYHATGIDDIGAAAGITGPAIYRHFKSKEAILQWIVLNSNSALLEQVHTIVRRSESATEALTELVMLFVRNLIDNRALAFVVMFERRSLSGETRAAFERSERMHFEEWVHALQQVRPELADTEARVMVRGATGLAFSAVTYRSGLPRNTLEPLIANMMLDALSVERPNERLHIEA